MADQRTEKPSKRRVEKSWREGKFLASREFIAACHFAAFVTLLTLAGGVFLEKLRHLARGIFVASVYITLTPETAARLYRQALFQAIVPLLLCGAGLTGMSLAAQLGASRLGISLQRLAPDWSRLSPLAKLKQIPQQNFPSVLQAMFLIPVMGFTAYSIAQENLTRYRSLPLLDARAAFSLIGDSFQSLLWKAAFALFLFGCLDLLRQQRRHSKSLRMTKQEVRDELKETDGNPQIKGRIRRIQRDQARRNMMKEIPTATAVVVNPTHFAVAIRYELDAMAAPRVVAKGKNYLALRIRQIATEHQVPIVENQPLAQALYNSADVGQEIPAQLYRAVAEILAYIYKLMQQQQKRSG
jgi:flagellar biosynthetic protein FlhB